ncbi:MAG: hypothetical protein AAFS10_10710, partial [Myxococcota bacterium]
MAPKRSQGWRGSASSAVMIGCLPTLPLGHRVLTVDDDSSEVTAAVHALEGVKAAVWRRRAIDNAPAHPWPPDGPFDAALIRLPKGRQAQEMVLHAAASVVRPMGHIYLYGTNDEGIRSMGKRLQQMFGAAQTIDARKHSRVYQAPREAEIEGLKPRLADWALQWTL